MKKLIIILLTFVCLNAMAYEVTIWGNSLDNRVMKIIYSLDALKIKYQYLDIKDNLKNYNDGIVFAVDHGLSYGGSILTYWPIVRVIDNSGFVHALSVPAYQTIVCLANCGATTTDAGLQKLPDLMLYPNPVDDIMYSSVPVDELTIVDMTGTTVRTFHNQESFDMSGLKVGCYVAVSRGNNVKIVKR